MEHRDAEAPQGHRKCPLTNILRDESYDVSFHTKYFHHVDRENECGRNGLNENLMKCDLFLVFLFLDNSCLRVLIERLDNSQCGYKSDISSSLDMFYWLLTILGVDIEQSSSESSPLHSLQSHTSHQAHHVVQKEEQQHCTGKLGVIV